MADPAPPKYCLAVERSAISVQEVPFHISVAAVGGPGGSPPKTIADVLLDPDPAAEDLAVFNSVFAVQEVPL